MDLQRSAPTSPRRIGSFFPPRATATKPVILSPFALRLRTAVSASKEFRVGSVRNPRHGARAAGKSQSEILLPLRGIGMTGWGESSSGTEREVRGREETRGATVRKGTAFAHSKAAEPQPGAGEYRSAGFVIDSARRRGSRREALSLPYPSQTPGAWSKFSHELSFTHRKWYYIASDERRLSSASHSDGIIPTNSVQIWFWMRMTK